MATDRKIYVVEKKKKKSILTRNQLKLQAKLERRSSSVF